MTDEELGRAWCGANGKSPSVGHGGSFRWYEGDGPTLADGPDDLPEWFSRCVPGEVCGGYRTEGEAFAAVGRAIRTLWAFADASRKQVGT